MIATADPNIHCSMFSVAPVMDACLTTASPSLHPKRRHCIDNHLSLPNIKEVFVMSYRLLCASLSTIR
eukprot:2193210-Amphidinium_carterae.1